MNKKGVAKVVKVIVDIVSFLLILIAVIEFISGQVGDNITLLGFDITENAQKITSYITSSGMVGTGGILFIINDFLGRKLKESRNLTNEAITVAVNTHEQVKDFTLKTTAQIGEVKKQIEELILLQRADLETKLNNRLIDKETKKIIEKALNQEKEEIEQEIKRVLENEEQETTL